MDDHEAHTETGADDASHSSSGLPSLELVLNEFHLDRRTLQDRAAQLDARGGVLIGFAGVLVGLVTRSSTPDVPLSCLQLWALILAAAAAASAVVGALWRQATSSMEPFRLRDYMMFDDGDARLAILDTRILLHLQDQKRVYARFCAVGLASMLLMAALVLLCLDAWTE